MSRKADPLLKTKAAITLPERDVVVARIRQTTEEADFLRKLLRLIESRDKAADTREESARG